MVCLEGLKAGVPLVAADSGGPAELFEHMNSGYLVPNKNPEAAADAIKHLITDLGLRRRFATKGREYVHQKFNVIKNAAELDKLYRSLTSGL
jgi:glycosyltransferase involved in cell wall biosynthesis